MHCMAVTAVSARPMACCVHRDACTRSPSTMIKCAMLPRSAPANGFARMHRNRTSKCRRLTSSSRSSRRRTTPTTRSSRTSTSSTSRSRNCRTKCAFAIYIQSVGLNVGGIGFYFWCHCELANMGLCMFIRWCLRSLRARACCECSKCKAFRKQGHVCTTLRRL